jgi:acetoin utilization deacetylase AcuC-like enzyme
MKIIFSGKCLEYEQPGHPESPERVFSSYELLKENYEIICPQPCSEKDLLLVHSKGLLDNVKSGAFFDLDTPNLAGMYEYARLSAGAAIQAAKLAVKQRAFSLMRPPGHHAGKDFLGGFCYFNNMALAITNTLNHANRAAILDIDVHFGNGTADIFLGSPRVLYVSLHQSPLYPGGGLKSEKNCINYPLNPGTEEVVYMKTLKQALQEIKKFHPDILGVSAGFDAYRGEIIANLALDIETYRKIGKMIKELGIPSFAVLEGGYSEDLKFCISEFLKGYG